jgi:DNA polymerase III subunit gamma/tau
MSDTKNASPAEPSARTDYQVVARRYRPQQFDDLIGQEPIAKALSGAIRAGRVGHAYLFTGARGVGKTSAARIFAKALNCLEGQTPTPCGVCDICRSIGTGDDMDVLEIDGASNRGIDEIRQLRQNSHLLPSRARLKIYIIDEVHMLTREAFNALLKTLEEPPEHVKFIFCTTDPNKLPITILSRCQRFDFAGIDTPAIAARLTSIAESEGATVEPEAIGLLARRAAGSMRDGQSLLEQVLSFTTEQITVEELHSIFGTAGDQMLLELLELIHAGEATEAIGRLQTVLREGVDPGALLEQLFGYLRDMMVASVGGAADMFLFAPSGSAGRLAELGQQWGSNQTVAAMQIVDNGLSRIKQSTQGPILCELTLVRLCRLNEVELLSDLIAQFRSGRTFEGVGDAEASKKKVVPAKKRTTNPAQSSKSTRPDSSIPSTRPVSPPTTVQEAQRPAENELSVESTPVKPTGEALSQESLMQAWGQVLGRLPKTLAERAGLADSVEWIGPNRLAATFKAEYTFARSLCARPDETTRIQRVWAEELGKPVSIEFRQLESDDDSETAPAAKRHVSPAQLSAEAAEHPLVRRAGDLFGAEVESVKKNNSQNR